MIYVFLYLVAIVLANLSIYFFGEVMLFINAFLFIGLDLTARDKLHSKWHNDGLFWKMSLLVLSGSLLTVLFSLGAWKIALASFLAFFLAGIVDSLVYHKLINKSFFVRVNGSNIPASLTDSIVFPTIAFGGFSLYFTLGQFLAKVLGGMFWGYIIGKLAKD
jgi:queuosine precursor transporter